MNEKTYNQYERRETIYYVASFFLSFTFFNLLFAFVSLVGFARYGFRIFDMDPGSLQGFWDYVDFLFLRSGFSLWLVTLFGGMAADLTFWPYFFRPKKKPKPRTQVRKDFGGRGYD